MGVLILFWLRFQYCHTATHTGGATLDFEVELLSLTKKPFFSMPQGNGFITAIFAIGAIVVAVYKLYERANKQQEELRGSKKKDKETKRSSGKTKKKN